MEETKNYYAIIPATIRYDNDLVANAKLLYGEITALCNEKGVCWASNDYFAKLYNVSKITISRWIKILNDKGYIKTKIIYKNNTKEIENRYIYISGDPINKNVNTPINKNVNTPINKNVKDNNTSITNNTYNNNIYINIVGYLNEKLKTNYKSTTPKTQQLIKARINEGFTLEDFKQVINKKYTEWNNNPKMCKYLRPETLFGTKFESYLNQDIKKRDTEEEILKYLEENNK